jgi:pyridoxamine 5'-phosphate oxidase
VTLLPEAVLSRFERIMDCAQQTSLREPTAVTLATAGLDGRPSARIVLMRGFDSRGFVFFTNSLSRKGRQIAENPHAALCFHWDELAEQVRVEGAVTEVGDDESDRYWSGRSRESQIGAWASLQSETLDRRETLEGRVRDFTDLYQGKQVPRPTHWHGYRVIPDRIEFWKDGAARLHERVLYTLQDAAWHETLLYP